MAESFMGEIRLVAFTFAPRNWATCDGQILPISQNTALFSLLGTTYGGNGQNTFALPNLQGRFPLHPGSGPGLTPRDLGETAGSSRVTLSTSEMPAHTHSLYAHPEPADAATARTDLKLATSVGGSAYGTGSADQPLVNMLTPAGQGQSHENRQPYLTLMFIISLQGVFPQHP